MSIQILRAPVGRAIRCLLFDCGETLWTSADKALLQQFEQAANKQALVVLSEYIAPTMFTTDQAILGEQLRTTISMQIQALTVQNPAYEPDFSLAVNTALAQLDLPQVSRTQALEIFEALRLPTAPSRQLFPDALTTLAALRERGFLLGIVTNRHYGGQPFMDGVRQLGLLDYFEPRHMAISADLGIRKPNAAIFQYALDALNVAPAEAAMVGDSLRADIAGAQNLQLYTIWKPKSWLLASLNPSGTQTIDADAWLMQAVEQENEKYQQRREPVMPDLIIEHLRDLLPLFVKAGQQ
ncbi:MAG TPA: HAD family hydrolase [Ktedonobacteraceae bacterium]|nr:HAD family hydrolase [Ktedonobacteraceae bacterium]